MKSSQPFAYVDIEELIRNMVPPRVVSGLVATARRARRAQSRMACSVAARWPETGKRLGIVKLHTGWNDRENGIVMFFMNNSLQTSRYITRMMRECFEMAPHKRLDGGSQ